MICYAEGTALSMSYSNGIITIAGMRVRPEEAATIRDFLTMVLNCHGLEGRSAETWHFDPAPEVEP